MQAPKRLNVFVQMYIWTESLNFAVMPCWQNYLCRALWLQQSKFWKALRSLYSIRCLRSPLLRVGGGGGGGWSGEGLHQQMSSITHSFCCSRSQLIFTFMVFFKTHSLTDIDECRNTSSCLNGATCQNTIGNFKCTCAKGFTGDNCGKVENICMKTPFFLPEEKRVMRAAHAKRCIMSAPQMWRKSWTKSCQHENAFWTKNKIRHFDILYLLEFARAAQFLLLDEVEEHPTVKEFSFLSQPFFPSSFHLTSSPPCLDTQAPISLVTPTFMKLASPSQTSDLLPPTEHSAIKVSARPVLLQSALRKLLSFVSSLASYLPLPLSSPTPLSFSLQYHSVTLNSCLSLLKCVPTRN